VAKGLKQRYVIDYEDTFSSMVKIAIIHFVNCSFKWIILSIAISNG
jgi:hypothetical protein